MLEKLWVAQPDHPGLPHYIIHSYDVPALAPRAVDAARRYAAIAPDAPHALHMPSHTFTRLGYWQDSIDDQHPLGRGGEARSTRSARSCTPAITSLRLPADRRRTRAARRVVDSLPEIAARRAQATGSAAPPPAAAFAVAAIPARYALERGAWTDAARLEPRVDRVPRTPTR